MSNWDATSSFSWFLYQADIAVLKSLEKVIEIEEDKIQDWELEVEWEEDFTLKNWEKKRSLSSKGNFKYYYIRLHNSCNQALWNIWGQQETFLSYTTSN